MKKLLLIISLFLFLKLSAQNTATFIKFIGQANENETLSGIHPTDDGGFYITALKQDNIWLIKCNENAEILWQKLIDIDNRTDEVKDILIDEDKNILLVGRTHNGGDAYTQNGFIMKINPENQKIIWTILGKTGTFFFSIVEHNNHYIISGNEYFSSVDGRADDAHIFSVNKNTGQMDGTIVGFDMGNTASENFTQIKWYKNAIYAWGRFTYANGYSSMRGTLTKLNTEDYKHIFTTSYVKHATNEAARLYGTSFVIDNNYIVAAQYGQLNGTDMSSNTKVILTKTNTEGNLFWTKSYQIGNYAGGCNVINAADGYYFISQTDANNNTFCVAKIDKNGNPIYARKFGVNAENGTQISNNNTGGFIHKSNGALYIGGTAHHNGSNQLLIIKMNANGEMVAFDKYCEKYFTTQTITAKTMENVAQYQNPTSYNYEYKNTAAKSKMQDLAANTELSVQAKICMQEKTDTLIPQPITPEKYDFTNKKSINLYLLLDVSGSMKGANKIDGLKQTFIQILQYLRPEDTVSIITFGGSNIIRLYPTSCGNKEQIIAILQNLNASGNTNFNEGLAASMDLVNANYNPQSNNQLLIATDGIFAISPKSMALLKGNKLNFHTNFFAYDAPKPYEKNLKTLAVLGNGNVFKVNAQNVEEKLLYILKQKK